ncbi:transcription termination factor MTERF9, chloroplastic isoform X2 [Phalaenopsis equestris]|uniref:transcription termination factor MTERF9, chloroplastic isoform X2 n=1 Tax=Phalaenopsis equestris TaxID=78828 RepID=UPI0009E4AC66|nr:transcription termination factor MTERF9, chloroplastic isoform X2 [Phalaenopsis equestris]
MLLSLCYGSASLLFSSQCLPWRPVCTGRGAGGNGVAVCSAHSNARILKPGRRPWLGRRTSIFADEDEEGKEEYEETECEIFDDDVLEHKEFCSNQYSIKKGRESEQSKNLALTSIKTKPAKTIMLKTNLQSYDTFRDKSSKKSPPDCDTDGQNCGNFTKIRFQKLIDELDFDERWFPLINYLSTFGLKESHFISIYERHMASLQINLTSAKQRLTFLIGVGVKHKDIKRILVRQPQILEYTVENNMMSHIRFLLSIGIPSSQIGRVITSTPSLFSYSIEHSLKPKIRFLVEEVGINGDEVGKVVQLSPQVLVQRVDDSWMVRSSFLSKELGAPRDNIVKMVTKHPQLLHYSIEDGILPRINFLRSIGMCNSDIVKVLTNLTQVLSLSLEQNLKPKYLYLVNELNNEVQSLIKYPMYLSLSLNRRIRPRHRFLVSLKKAPKGPFPLSRFVPSDECFCEQWAGTTLDKYLAFRQSLLLSDFANKYETKSSF